MKIISLNDLSKDDVGFAKAIGESLNDIGFFALKDHGISPQLIESCYSSAEAVFKLPIEEKIKYQTDGGRRGFTPFGTENAKGNNAADLKEFWQIGSKSSVYKNLWPSDCYPTFEKDMSSLYTGLDALSRTLMRSLALYLELDPGFFESKIEGGESIVRVIHYPPVTEDMNPASIRAAAHEDINLITLLVNSTSSGLQVLSNDGAWVNAPVDPGLIIVDSGDMIQNLTNGFLKSTTHRVINPDNSRERRFSMPFFIHPRADVDLSPIEKFRHADGRKNYPSITAGEYLQQRLKEIGLMK